MKGGANNQVYRIDLQEGDPVILKSYFQHPQDARPRLKAEFEFLTFGWNQGIRCIPQPIFQDPVQNLALYTYVEGSLASPIHADESFVHSAASFLFALNQKKKSGQHLLDASEACLQTMDFIHTVEKKLSNLLNITDMNPLLSAFLYQELLPYWAEVKEKTCKAALHHLDPSSEDLFLTPSDFGLHNALITSSKQPCFIDFEYAGWDDPAKTICDFFLQPKIPIPYAYFDAFAQQVASLSANREKTFERTTQMFPVCHVKWCCIILNVFLKTGKSRREFANSDQIAFQENQIELARKHLSKFSSLRP